MLCLFECFLAVGASGEGILTSETMADTQAQIMTDREAAKLGFEGLPPNESGRERRLIVCASGADMRRIQNALEASPQVDSFRVHEIDA